MHVTFTIHADYVTFRTSDGRSGSEPTYGMGPAPTVTLIMHKIGAISERGVTPGWTFEAIRV